MKGQDEYFRWSHHLYGMLVHGRVSPVRFLIHDQRIPHDSNLTINSIMMVLDSIGWDKLPPKLALQLDNTCRENKNNIVFAFLALLHEYGVFEEVRLYYSYNIVHIT